MDKEKKSFTNTNTHKLHVWFNASSCACSLLHTHKQVLSEAPDHPVLGVAVVGYRWKFSKVSSLPNWQYELAVELTFENSYQSFLESLRYEYLQQSWLPRALDRWLYMYICACRECALTYMIDVKTHLWIYREYEPTYAEMCVYTYTWVYIYTYINWWYWKNEPFCLATFCADSLLFFYLLSSFLSLSRTSYLSRWRMTLLVFAPPAYICDI